MDIRQYDAGTASERYLVTAEIGLWHVAAWCRRTANGHYILGRPEDSPKRKLQALSAHKTYGRIYDPALPTKAKLWKSLSKLLNHGPEPNEVRDTGTVPRTASQETIMAKKRGRAKESRTVAQQIEDLKKRDAEKKEATAPVALQRLSPVTLTPSIPPPVTPIPAFDPDRPQPGPGNDAALPVKPAEELAARTTEATPVTTCKAHCGPGLKRVCGKPVEDGRYCKRHELTSRIKKAISHKATAQNIVAALVAAEAGFGAEASRKLRSKP